MKILNPFSATEVENAFRIARNDGLPVLVDFWSEGCKGCKKMDETTYRNDKVLQYLGNRFVFVKYNITHRRSDFRNSFITSPFLWTPCFIVFANDGSEVRKITGYLPPHQFLEELEMGRAMAAMRKARSETAHTILVALCDSAKVPSIRQEALYWAGVAAYYSHKKDLAALVPYWDKLIRSFPGSTWAERADCLV